MSHTDTLALDLLTALPRLRRYARVLVGERDGADELVEEVLAGVRRKERVRPSKVDCVTWLFGLIHAAHRPDRQSSTHRADSVPVTAELCAQVLRLPIEEREVLMLVAVERLAYADIAIVLDVPVATVLLTLTRAREHLSAIESRP